MKKKYPHLQLEYRMLKVYDVPESQLAQMLENWEDALKEGLKLAYSSFSGTGEITYYGERGKCKTPG